MIVVNNIDSDGKKIAFLAISVCLLTQQDYGTCIHLYPFRPDQKENLIRCNEDFNILLQKIEREKNPDA